MPIFIYDKVGLGGGGEGLYTHTENHCADFHETHSYGHLLYPISHTSDKMQKIREHFNLTASIFRKLPPTQCLSVEISHTRYHEIGHGMWKVSAEIH